MKQLNKLLQAQFDAMCATGKLFRSSMSGQQVWDRYLVGFGDDPVFRDPASSVHNCNQCNSFVRRYGNIVAVLPDGELTCLIPNTTPVQLPEVKNKAGKVIRKAMTYNKPVVKQILHRRDFL